MKDRGMIKWQPFNSVISSKIIIDEIIDEKLKVKMPILSDEQIMDIENMLLESFTNQEIMEFYYFKNGKILKKINYITKIIYSTQKIVFNDNSALFFKQLINIKKI